MRVRELVMDKKELWILITVLGGGIGLSKMYEAHPAPAYAEAAPRIDTLAVLTSDVRQLKDGVATLRADIQAMLRAQCVTNPSKWEVYETAGIQCADIIPSAKQAGRIRR
jgi:hypothetical protein